MVWLDKDDIWFPDPYTAPGDYPVAVGGDLSPERLLFAYSLGIFPWYSEGEPILWWSLDPRMVLFPKNLRISRSLKKVLRNKGFKVSFDGDFVSVIKNCATVRRKGQTGTWLTPEMIEAYVELHRLGYAHSVEVYLKGELVGGLYGVSLGGVFFGESMFHKVSDASKVAFVHLVKRLEKWGFDMVDCQQSTPHMARLGAVEIPRRKFLDILQKSLKKRTLKGNWGKL
ncbi:leucyl/phenylalanyl-tRNA--protein transferase [Persephonella hydrogeniphila]|uniref:Leucyl/phenylalanyl-tRNA--protein transferase n=1 Tax=Persephonella hydrogeniphila TaxID=198703 RepID=A0A285NS26_9AQUI|nr:leucyl/phenylalanyl-tRNA--protein transferase [Persephonella hydrogeniphila]SNZ11767.1 leucyl/phenylalanyl-tRNA--protein transferase [Persephonella hydrogeniphila]